MLKASIDLGTNTCLLLIAEWDEKRNELIRIVEDHSTVVRLGEGVDRARVLQPAAMERVIVCLRHYEERVRKAGLDPTQAICVATSQARDSGNSAEFFLRVKKETDFSFKTLSGEEEAKFTFLGALLPGMDPSLTAVIDIGGGSTEITTLDWARSVDIGSVRMTERFLKSNPPSVEEFENCLKRIEEPLRIFESFTKQNTKNYRLVAVAGTATSLAAWHLGLTQFDADKIDAATLKSTDILKMMNQLKGMSCAEKQALPLMDPKRADVILAGCMILWSALNKLRFQECSISTRGLRFGVLRMSA